MNIHYHHYKNLLLEDLSIVGNRLKEFLFSKNMKTSELGKLSNNSGTQIYNIIKGKKYGVDKFMNVLKALPELNVYWLLWGEGNMIRSEEIKTTNKTESIAIDQNPNQTDKEGLKEKEIANLNAVIAYQEMTISAYKRALDIAAGSNEDLKKMIEFYKTQNDQLANKTA